MNKVVKAVFGEDRRRVSAYAMALRAAFVAGPDVQASTAHVPADQLAAWIESKGGVEEIRLGGKNSGDSGLSEKDRAGIAQGAVAAGAPLMTFKPDVKTMPFSADDEDKMMVLLVTYLPTGDLEVRSVVRNDNAVRAALAAHYSDHKAEIASAEQVQNMAHPTAVSVALSI